MKTLSVSTCLNPTSRLSVGALSEDPNFPKIQWPSPELCPACHSVKDNGDHKWNDEQVLPFLLSYFSAERILTGTGYLQFNKNETHQCILDIFIDRPASCSGNTDSVVRHGNCEG